MSDVENKEVENKVENVDDKLEDVSGGFVGRDWDESYQYIYRQLGITHLQNYASKDEYMYNGKLISKEKVKAMVDEWRKTHTD